MILIDVNVFVKSVCISACCLDSVADLSQSWFDLIFLNFLFQMLIFSITLHSTCNPKAAVFQSRGQRTHHSAIMSLRDGGQSICQSRSARLQVSGSPGEPECESAASGRFLQTGNNRVKALQTLQPPQRLA